MVPVTFPALFASLGRTFIHRPVRWLGFRFARHTFSLGACYALNTKFLTGPRQISCSLFVNGRWGACASVGLELPQSASNPPSPFPPQNLVTPLIPNESRFPFLAPTPRFGIGSVGLTSSCNISQMTGW